MAGGRGTSAAGISSAKKQDMMNINPCISTYAFGIGRSIDNEIYCASCILQLLLQLSEVNPNIDHEICQHIHKVTSISVCLQVTLS